MPDKKYESNKNEPLNKIGKEKLKEYLIKTGQLVMKPNKNKPHTRIPLSEFGKKKLEEYLRKIGQIKD